MIKVQTNASRWERRMLIGALLACFVMLVNLVLVIVIRNWWLLLIVVPILTLWIDIVRRLVQRRWWSDEIMFVPGRSDRP